MHSSNDAAQQPSLKHADLFSFPRTQRNGLLDSTIASKTRSQDQRLNLRTSYERLLDALSVKPLKRAEAF